MADMRDWQAADDIFAAVAGSGGAFRGRITDGAAPERIRVNHFTEDYLPMLGVTPILGRGFTRDDTNPGSPLVALLGYGYWQSRYGGRDDVVGESIRLDDESATIVGVLPAWFNATTPLTTPLRVQPRMFNRSRHRRGLSTPAFVRASTLEQARRAPAGAMSSATRPPRGSPRSTAGHHVAARIVDCRNTATSVAIFAGAVGLILLIAAVNVAGLLLARGSARYSEFAVRASLGAGRSRLIRQLLTESLALAIPATALGLLLAWLSLGIIEANLPFTLPQNSPIAINRTVLLMTIALLVPTTLLFSVVPAFRLTHFQIDAVLARGCAPAGIVVLTARRSTADRRRNCHRGGAGHRRGVDDPQLHPDVVDRARLHHRSAHHDGGAAARAHGGRAQGLLRPAAAAAAARLRRSRRQASSTISSSPADMP